MTKNELKLLKENSRLKLGIIVLIEEMEKCKEYRNIVIFLNNKHVVASYRADK